MQFLVEHMWNLLYLNGRPNSGLSEINIVPTILWGHVGGCTAILDHGHQV